MKNKYLFVVTDESSTCEQITRIGNRHGYEVLCTTCADDILESLAYKTPTLLIVDQDLPNFQDVIRLTKLGINQYCSAMILLNGKKDYSKALQLDMFESLNIIDRLKKPVSPELLGDNLVKAENRYQSLSYDDLCKAIDNNEFMLFYQPKVSLKSQQVVGAEVLIRLQHHEMGIIGPGQFLPLIEKHNLFARLNTWILETCFQQNAVWNRANVNLQLNINIAESILSDSAFIDTIDKLSTQYRIDNSKIFLEITEQAAYRTPLHPLYRQLKTLGFELVIDDFGLLPIEMDVLSKPYFSTLKINKNFVLGLGKDANSNKFVKALTDLGHAMGYSVEAVGLETAEAWQLLGVIGCDFGQGYYISRPVSVLEFNKWLAIS